MISTVLPGLSGAAKTNRSVRSRRASSPGCWRLAALKWFDMVTPSVVLGWMVVLRARKGHGSALPGWSWLVLDGESQFCEHRDGARFPALEVAGVKALAGGELIGCAQDRFRRVTAFV